MIGLEYILGLYKKSNNDAAEKLGIRPQNVSRWFSGERKIPEKYIPQLSEMFDIPEFYFQKELDELDKLKIEKIKIENEAELIEVEQVDSETGETYLANYNTLDETALIHITYEIDKKELVKNLESRITDVFDTCLSRLDESFGSAIFQQAAGEALDEIGLYQEIIDTERKANKEIFRRVIKALHIATTGIGFHSDKFIKELIKLIRDEIDRKEKEQQEFVHEYYEAFGQEDNSKDD